MSRRGLTYRYGLYRRDWFGPMGIQQMLDACQASDPRFIEVDLTEPGRPIWRGIVTFDGWQCYFSAYSCDPWSKAAEYIYGSALPPATINIDWSGRYGRLGRDRDDAMRKWLVIEMEDITRLLASVKAREEKEGRPKSGFSTVPAFQMKLDALRRQMAEAN